MSGFDGKDTLSKRATRFGAFALLIIATLIFLSPFIWSISLSFQEPGDVLRWPVKLIPDPATLENYVRLFTELSFPRWLFNSLLIVLVVTACNLFFDALAGYAFARMRFPGKDLIFMAFLATLMVPGHVTLVPKFMLLNEFGWINTYQGLIAPGIVQVFGIFLMKQFFESVPRELEEAARIDGCSRFETFYKVVLPISKAPLVALGIYTFQGNWNDFLWPVIVTTTPDMYTLPMGMAMFRYEFKVEWTMLMAGSVFIALPMLIIFLSFQRLFIQSAASSGLKG
nr:carbohydrate ABC transporter permease [Hyphomonas sp. Mor2]